MIRRQIQADLDALTQKIQADDFEAVTFQEGEVLSTKALRALVKYDIKTLKTMLASRVIPETYTSLEQKIIVRSDEEALLSKDLSPGLFTLFATKCSRKDFDDLEQSYFSLYQEKGDPITHFRIEHKKNKHYPQGAYAQKVKKGYDLSQSERKYAIKIFKRDLFPDDRAHEMRMAMRGSYCSRLLGGAGFTFRHHHKQYFVSDWQEGLPLSKVAPQWLIALPIKPRIRLALDLIEQVVILHRNELIHCDIKPSNVMLFNGKITLIDLDSVRLKTEFGLGLPPHTARYLRSDLNVAIKNNPKAYKLFNEQSDLFALALTVTFLFPDILKSIPIQTTVPIEGNATPFEHPALRHKFGTAYKGNEKLAGLLLSLIVHSSSPNRLLSSIALFEKLATLYNTQYRGHCNLAEPDLKKTQALSGPAAFAEIEVELVEYNDRAGIFKQYMSTRPVKPPADEKAPDEPLEETRPQSNPAKR